MSSNWAGVVAAAVAGRLDVSGIADLAVRLADSGQRLAGRRLRTADLASTGGPTSLSTMICPPTLAAAGWEVPKLGVAGRPAGGVDVLAAIQGYQVTLGISGAHRVLDSCGYVHLDAGGVFAPDDAELFRFRQSVGAQAVPCLAIASLLAKKLAMGVDRVGLEVRVAPHGNFGANRSSARSAAERFCEVARLLGLKPVCILTDGTQPYQPYVGRGESIVALELVIDGGEDAWLGSHLSDCFAMSVVVGGAQAAQVARTELTGAIVANLTAQGGSLAALRHRAAEVRGGHVHELLAVTSGEIRYDLGALRNAVISAQGTTSRGWPDAAGVMLVAPPASVVAEGDLVMTVRCLDSDWPGMRRALAAAVRIGHRVEAPIGGILEVVGV